jgi:hypothetical protein
LGESSLFEESASLGAFPGLDFRVHPIAGELYLAEGSVSQLVGEHQAGQGQLFG